MVSTRSGRSTGAAGAQADTAATKAQRPARSSRRRADEGAGGAEAEAGDASPALEDVAEEREEELAGDSRSPLGMMSPLVEKEILRAFSLKRPAAPAAGAEGSSLQSPSRGLRSPRAAAIAADVSPAGRSDGSSGGVRMLSQQPLPRDDDGNATPDAFASEEDEPGVLKRGRAGTGQDPRPRRRRSVAGALLWLLLASALALLLACALGPTLAPHLPPAVRQHADPFLARCLDASAYAQDAWRGTVVPALVKAGQAHPLLASALQHLPGVPSLAPAPPPPSAAASPAAHVGNSVAAATAAAASRSATPSPHFTARLGFEAFRRLLPDGPGFHDDAVDVWRGAAAAAEQQQKGSGLLLVCGQAAGCDAAAAAVAAAVPEGLAAVLDGGDYSGQDRGGGALQERLTAFLTSAPDGVVLLTSPHRLAPAALSVLNNAMSESGSLQHMGQPVRASGALYLLLLEAPELASSWDSGAALGSGSGFEAAAKQALHKALLASWGEEVGGSKGEEGGSGEGGLAELEAALLRALRRRIDFAAPLRGADRGARVAAGEEEAAEGEVAEGAGGGAAEDVARAA